MIARIMAMMCLCAALIVTIKFTVPLATFFNHSPLINNVVDNQFMQRFMVAIGAGPITAELLQQLFYSISMLVWFVGTYSLCEGALAYSGYIQSLSLVSAAISSKLGAALGCTRGYIVSLVFLAIFTLHIFKGQDNFITGSFFARLFQSSTIRLDSLISGQRPEEYMKAFQGKDLYNSEQIMQQLGAPGGVPSSGIAPQSQPPAQPKQYRPEYFEPQSQPSSQQQQPDYYQPQIR